MSEATRVDRRSLILSVNRALWGEVGPALRRVTAKADAETVFLRFYFDGELSEEDRDSVNCIGAEVIADFPHLDLDEQVERCDFPEPVSQAADWLTVFARREPLDPI